MSELNLDAAPLAKPSEAPEPPKPAVAPSTGRWRVGLEAIVLPLGAILVSMVLFGIFCSLAGANPFAVYASIKKAAFGSWFAFQNTLLRAAPLMLCALCTAIPIRLGLVIIGNEGALVIGGLCATAVGLSVINAPPFVVHLAMALTGFAVGGGWIAFAGALKQFRGVNETISTLLMNYIAIAFLNHAVNGPMKDPSSLNKPSSFPIPDEKLLQPLLGTQIHWGLVFGIIACIAAWFLIQKTTFGFQVRTIGGNIRAAKIAGIPVGKVSLIACFLAGGCAGLAGMVEIAAIQGAANESLSAGYGYSGFLVAFLARQNPLGCMLLSVLLGGLLTSGGILQRIHHLPDATIAVFQGLVFIVILFSESLYGRFKFFQERG